MSSPGIPALVHRTAGGAGDATRILTEVGGYAVEEVDPREIGDRVKAIAAQNSPRVLVAGGDGSLCAAAHALGESRTELAILPAGTLNHLAKHLGLPTSLRQAAQVARGGITRPVDAGSVNGRLFLNTSSVGAYETFVRRREAIEGRWGYHIASLIAGWRILVSTPMLTLTVEIEGVKAVYRTPLVFLGVGERELRIPSLGARIAHGKRGLHVMIVRGRSGARLASLAIQAATRGVEAMSGTPAMDSLVVDRLRIEDGRQTVSVDGELIDVAPPLEYRFLPAALRVVVAERREAARPAVLEV